MKILYESSIIPSWTLYHLYDPKSTSVIWCYIMIMIVLPFWGKEGEKGIKRDIEYEENCLYGWA